jgi:hypothetical protein
VNPQVAKPEEKKKEELELEISRTTIPIFIEPGVTREQVVVTFWSREILPTTIFIWKDEWSEEKELELIKKKIEEMRKAGSARVKITL